jgi:cell division protein ZipA
MPELRWILIVLGLLLLAGLWWWETRRRMREQDPEQAAGSDTAATPEGGEASDADRIVPGSSRPAEDVPSIRASRRERGHVGRALPVVEIPDDVEPELAKPAPPPEEDFVPPNVPYRAMGEALDDIPEDLRNLPRDERAEAEQHQPWVRTQPLDRNEIRAANYGAGVTDRNEPGDDGPDREDEPEEADPQATSDSARQRIVALRLICDRGRWPGREVVDSLRDEGMTFGKYSIFHRERDDGKTIFFIASMVEPGSFDLDRVDEQSFPGISIFAVVPGPVDAPTAFDLMLACARRLAERLGGHLQDEQGSSLTAQRILNLREELVHFEHVSRRLKKQ